MIEHDSYEVSDPLREMYLDTIDTLSNPDLGLLVRVIGKTGLPQEIRDVAERLASQERGKGKFEHFEAPTNPLGFVPLGQFSDFLNQEGFDTGTIASRIINTLDRITTWESPSGRSYPIVQWVGSDVERTEAEDSSQILSQYIRTKRALDPNASPENDFRLDVGALDESLEDPFINEITGPRTSATSQILRDFVRSVRQSKGLDTAPKHS